MHVLKKCTLYEELRAQLKSTTKNLITEASETTIYEVFNDPSTVQEVARFLQKCHSKRHPQKEDELIKEDTATENKYITTDRRNASKAAVKKRGSKKSKPRKTTRKIKKASKWTNISNSYEHCSIEISKPSRHFSLFHLVSELWHCTRCNQ